MTTIVKNSKGEFVSRMSIAEFARACGLSEGTIRARIKTGKLAAERKGKTWLIDPDLVEDQEIEANNVMGNNGDIVKQSELIQAKTKKEKAIAEMKQMELEELKKNLVSSDKVYRDSFKCARLLRDSIMRIPGRVAAEIACETDPHKCEILLENEIRKSLEIVANTDIGEFFEEEYAVEENPNQAT